MPHMEISVFELNNTKKHDGYLDLEKETVVVPNVGSFSTQKELEVEYRQPIVASLDRYTTMKLSEMGFKSKFSESDSRTVSVHVDGTIYQSFIDKILDMERAGYKVSFSQVISQTLLDGIKYSAMKKEG